MASLDDDIKELLRMGSANSSFNCAITIGKYLLMSEADRKALSIEDKDKALEAFATAYKAMHTLLKEEDKNDNKQHSKKIL